jgi:hypothetical protein
VIGITWLVVGLWHDGFMSVGSAWLGYKWMGLA